MTEQTLVICKPDAIQRQLVGAIIHKYEKKGLKIVGLKMIKFDTELAEKHYAEHKGKPFYPALIDFIISDPVVVMILEGTNAIETVRSLNGATNALQAEPCTIRGEYSLSNRYNLVHASDSPESAAREIKNFFNENEILDYNLITSQWLK